MSLDSQPADLSSGRQPKQRIVELDLLRGFALCGIFLMNIVAMAHPLEAYTNPLVFLMSDMVNSDEMNGWSTALNHVVFSLNYVFVNQKMMGLFSLLFGASTILFLSKLKENGQSSGYYFKRNAWLFLFGLLHGFFLYIGDILFVYGLCALILYWFVVLRARWQLILGLVIYCLPIAQQGLMQFSVDDFSMAQLQQLNDIWQPSIEAIKEAIEYKRSANYWDSVLAVFDWSNFSNEPNSIYDWYWNAILIEGFFRSFGMMLIGMSFFKWGVLPNKDKRKSTLFYLKMMIVCFVIGIIFVLVDLWLNYHHNWDASYSAIGGRLLNHIGAPFLSCAYLAMLILWSMKRSSIFIEKFKQKLQAVGRMALTNYIMQSVIGLFVFTNVGFNLYGQLNRLELVLLVLLVCLFQLWFSNVWLKCFRYGPLEWLWRSLTYVKLVKLVK